jgi:hypothetical protein
MTEVLECIEDIQITTIKLKGVLKTNSQMLVQYLFVEGK